MIIATQQIYNTNNSLLPACIINQNESIQEDLINVVNSTRKLPDSKCLVLVPSGYAYQWPGVVVKQKQYIF